VIQIVWRHEPHLANGVAAAHSLLQFYNLFLNERRPHLVGNLFRCHLPFKIRSSNIAIGEFKIISPHSQTVYTYCHFTCSHVKCRLSPRRVLSLRSPAHALQNKRNKH